MPPIPRPPIQWGQELTVLKPFKFAGKFYKPAEIFPYQRMSVSRRKVDILYNSGLIGVDRDKIQKHTAAFVEPSEDAAPVEEKPKRKAAVKKQLRRKVH